MDQRSALVSLLDQQPAEPISSGRRDLVVVGGFVPLFNVVVVVYLAHLMHLIKFAILRNRDHMCAIDAQIEPHLCLPYIFQIGQNRRRSANMCTHLLLDFLLNALFVFGYAQMAFWPSRKLKQRDFELYLLNTQRTLPIQFVEFCFALFVAHVMNFEF